MQADSVDSSILIFVYGTLKRDGSRSAALRDQQFIAEVQTLPRYRLYDCGSYPGLVEADDGLSIHGELWSVNPECVVRLDRIEAVEEGLYERRAVRLLNPHDEADVQTYFYRQSIDGLPNCGERWSNPA